MIKQSKPDRIVRTSNVQILHIPNCPTHYSARLRYFVSSRLNTASADFPVPLATPAAIAARSVAFWRAAAFFITSVYTRFFSAAEALRIKSENFDDVAGFDFERADMAVTLEQFVCRRHCPSKAPR